MSAVPASFWHSAGTTPIASVLVKDTDFMDCPCCQLKQRKAIDYTGITAAVCAKCTYHQGEQEVMRLKRAESHEAILRERMDACRASEARENAEAGEARAAASEAKRRTAEALKS